MNKLKPSIIDLEGKIHLCDPNNIIDPHRELAKKLRPNSKDNYADFELLELGYIFVGSQYRSPYSGKEPNEYQITTLYDLEIQYITNFYNMNGKCWKAY